MLIDVNHQFLCVLLPAPCQCNKLRGQRTAFDANGTTAHLNGLHKLLMTGRRRKKREKKSAEILTGMLPKNSLCLVCSMEIQRLMHQSQFVGSRQCKTRTFIGEIVKPMTLYTATLLAIINLNLCFDKVLCHSCYWKPVSHIHVNIQSS